MRAEVINLEINNVGGKSINLNYCFYLHLKFIEKISYLISNMI